jgi:hypothetical protein
MLLVFACGGYYGISLALDKLAVIKLPRPEIAVPSLSDLGIDLPSWLTGVVGGSGQVLVVSGVPDEGLNLRAGPGLNAEVIELLPNNTRVRRLDRPCVVGNAPIDGPCVVDGVLWLPVRGMVGDRNVEGWASSLFLKPE